MRKKMKFRKLKIFSRIYLILNGVLFAVYYFGPVFFTIRDEKAFIRKYVDKSLYQIWMT